MGYTLPLQIKVVLYYVATKRNCLLYRYQLVSLKYEQWQIRKNKNEFH